MTLILQKVYKKVFALTVNTPNRLSFVGSMTVRERLNKNTLYYWCIASESLRDLLNVSKKIHNLVTFLINSYLFDVNINIRIRIEFFFLTYKGIYFYFSFT